MSRYTNKELRKLFIYQVYIRNHTEEGTFKAFSKDLDRIKDLGVDIVYLMPIHEIGQKNKKGTLGCPYSIKDYRSVNHEYGTIDDFKDLVKEVHKRDMKIMIDIVFNHTSYDSVLIEEHPEYFYKVDGEFKNRVGDWWDITDLDYTVSQELWTEQIDVLRYWTRLGVDGFRWDVASFLPIEFLEEAHDSVLELNPDSIWISESVHGGFLKYFREMGFYGLSESEIYQVFDISYDYDTHNYFENYLKGEIPFRRYLEEVERQEYVYPENYIKLRNLENHDFGRFAPMVKSDTEKIINWTALNFFLRGCNMMYAGQEFCDTNRPDLFEKDLVNWDGFDISDYVLRLSKIVKNDHFVYGNHYVEMTDKDLFIGKYEYNNETIIGIFNVGLEIGEAYLEIKDGIYKNLIDDTDIEIENNTLILTNKPVIIKVVK